MQNTATATRGKPKAARQQAPRARPKPRNPMTPDQRAALDVLHAAAAPGFELALGPAGSEVLLSARVKRAKRYGYGAPTAILFLDALPALDGLTRTEFRVLLRVLARAPFGDNVAPISAAGMVVHHTARGGSGPRGSSVLDGAADTMMEVVKGNDDEVRLAVTKQKDGEDDVVAVFQRETINLVPTTHRRKRSSLFLRFIGNEKRGDGDKQAGPEDGLSQRQREVLAVLRAANGRALTTRDILDALRLDEVPERATCSVFEALKALAKREALGLERVSDRQWRVASRP
jgi:hypothetical protein